MLESSFLTIYRYFNADLSVFYSLNNHLSISMKSGGAASVRIFPKSARTNIAKAVTRYIDKTRYI